jgi:alkylresorcinol/alkylpyrone synthase
LEILATHRVLFAGTQAADGVRLTASGWRLLRQDGIPRIIQTSLRPAVTDFVERQGLSLNDISFWVAHPRTPQILEAIRETLHLGDADIACARRVWENRGNTISAAVFFVLRELFEQASPPAGLGVMLAIGAGLTCEMLLVRTSSAIPTFN